MMAVLSDSVYDSLDLQPNKCIPKLSFYGLSTYGDLELKHAAQKVVIPD